jgi:hypothetical protein
MAAVVASRRWPDVIAPEPGNTRGWPRNARQVKFALLLVRDGLGSTEAYRVAFGKERDGLAARRLRAQLRPFLLFLQEQKNLVMEREFEVTIEKLVREAASIALADRTTYYMQTSIEGMPKFVGKPPDELTPIQRLAVKSWTETQVLTDDGPLISYEYVLHDREHARQFLGKHLGMLSETLLVDMISRRQAAESLDLSHLPTEQLDKIQGQLEEIQEQLKDAGAIAGEVEKS